MIDIAALSSQFNNRITIEKVSENTYRIYAPFFYEDGDMFDLFLKENGDSMCICDLGTTLMKVSYQIDIDSENRVSILNKIVANNGIQNNNGNLFINTSVQSFFNDLMQFQVAISKVSNLDILRREYVSSMFFEYFNSFVMTDLSKKFVNIKESFKPTNEDCYVSDYAILDNPQKPIFLLGIKNDLQAARATAFCLRMTNEKDHSVSIAIHDNLDSLSKRDRDALTNAVFKQYTTLDDFKRFGPDFIRKVIA